MTGKTPSSDRHNGPPALAASLTVLEGMPGAGKTTTGQRIAATGAHLLGEYTTGRGTTIPITDHPAPGDDAAHQANWLRKAAQARVALANGRPVVCDRDWTDAHPALGAALRRARWRHVSGHDDPQHQFQIARDLAGHQ